MNVFINKKTRALILIMCALVFIGIIISRQYYKNINQSVDPRIIKARNLYEKYNKYAQYNEFDSVFLLMDSIETIYSESDHYKNSYEVGVLYNNRAASFLTMSLYLEKYKNIQDSLINMAEFMVFKSINIYESWLTKFQDKTPEAIEKMITNDFYSGLENYNEEQKIKFLKHRMKELLESQSETKRRLSVSYTNLGIIYRHKQEYESAARSYKTAVDLWDQNLTAENNLNILLGRPLKKRNFIQKLFPPDKDKN